MNSQRIRFIEQVQSPLYSENKDSYQVRNDKPLVWLQTLCCAVLRKLGAYEVNQSIAYTYKDVDVSNLVDGIYAQVGVLANDYNSRAKRVLMGSEDFANLCKAEEARYLLTVYATSPTFGGLTVTVIPWMKGILVMPE